MGGVVGRVRGRGMEGVEWQMMIGLGTRGGRVVERMHMVDDLGGECGGGW